MAEGAMGRSITLYFGSTPIASLTSRNFAINNELADQTSDDDGAWRNVLAEPGVKTVSFGASGVFKAGTKALIARAMNEDDVTEEMRFVWADGAELSGVFAMESFNLTGERNGAATFDCTFQNKGKVSYDAGT